MPSFDETWPYEGPTYSHEDVEHVAMAAMLLLSQFIRFCMFAHPDTAWPSLLAMVAHSCLLRGVKTACCALSGVSSGAKVCACGHFTLHIVACAQLYMYCTGPHTYLSVRHAPGICHSCGVLLYFHPRHAASTISCECHLSCVKLFQQRDNLVPSLQGLPEQWSLTLTWELTRP